MLIGFSLDSAGPLSQVTAQQYPAVAGMEGKYLKQLQVEDKSPGAFPQGLHRPCCARGQTNDGNFIMLIRQTGMGSPPLHCAVLEVGRQ